MTEGLRQVGLAAVLRRTSPCRPPNCTRQRRAPADPAIERRSEPQADADLCAGGCRQDDAEVRVALVPSGERTAFCLGVA